MRSRHARRKRSGRARGPPCTDPGSLAHSQREDWDHDPELRYCVFLCGDQWNPQRRQRWSPPRRLTFTALRCRRVEGSEVFWNGGLHQQLFVFSSRPFYTTIMRRGFGSRLATCAVSHALSDTDTSYRHRPLVAPGMMDGRTRRNANLP